MNKLFEAIHEWWIGVRRLDVRVWRYADKCNTEVRVRCAPFGLVRYATMTKHDEPWQEFWDDIQNLVHKMSDGGTSRVPVIHMVFAEARRRG